jgi:tRNA (mo5U34)-methyltransferase
VVREKRISLAGTELTLRLGDHQAERLVRSWPYVRLVAPTLRRLEPRGTGRRHRPDFEPMPVVYPCPAQLPEETEEQRALVNRIAGRGWYHTIDLGHGVRTPGEFDHALALQYVPLPASLAGKRCLDVATLDGFWAFEMERRGAAEVVALDIDSWNDLDLPPKVLDDFRRRGRMGPTGAGFQIAAELRQSQVKRQICNVYDLSPESVGEFDVVFCGDLLLHLRNPHRALQNICAVTRGEAVLMEPYVPALDSAGFEGLVQLVAQLENVHWWGASRSFLEKAIRLAGFAHVAHCGSVDIRGRSSVEVAIPRAMFRARGKLGSAGAQVDA